MSLSRAVRIASGGGGRRDWSTPNSSFSNVGAIVCNAATRYVRKRVGSLSPSSSDSQAAGGHSESHCADQGGFPKTGGGRDKGEFAVQPSFSRSIRRGRRTTLRRGVGIYSFVAKIDVDIPPYQACVHHHVSFSSASIPAICAKDQRCPAFPFPGAPPCVVRSIPSPCSARSLGVTASGG